jgi:hypothetical protein
MQKSSNPIDLRRKIAAIAPQFRRLRRKVEFFQ